MKISFCITCMGRLHHLRETLPRNLEDNADCADLEFVLLDYNSQDGLEEWARDALRPHLPGGRVIYYRERTAIQYVCAHAKNVAYGLATGDVLCNLDADGFTGKGYAALVAETFAREGSGIITRLADPLYAGRIAVARETFRALRGYDEDFIYGWGYEDIDFRERAAAHGLRPVTLHPAGYSRIEHSQEERVRFALEKGNPFLSCDLHKFFSEEKLKDGLVVRNQERKAGSAVVFRNFADEPIQAGW